MIQAQTVNRTTSETPTHDVSVVKDFTDLNTWWDEYASCYEDRSWEVARSLLAEIIQHAPGGPILDVGCGYGFLAECARRFGIGAIGLEGSERALQVSRKLHPLADMRAWKAGTDFPISSDSIGCVVVNEFVDHITIVQNRSMLLEAYRVLSDDGVLIVKSPSKFNRFDKDLGHVTFFSPREFNLFVQSFSFHIVSQPYSPQPLLGSSRVGWLAMRMLAKLYQPEKWAARIDLVARKIPLTIT